MHRTHLSLEKWFWAMYLFTYDKRGCSAKQLQRQVGLTYKTAWYLAQRIRSAMQEREWNTMLSGLVEVDEAYIGAPAEGGKRGRGTEKATIAAAVSLDKDGHPLYAKIELIDDVKSRTLAGFAHLNIESGSTISSDALKPYNKLSSEGFIHEPKKIDPKDGSGHLKWFHTIVSNLKSEINGTYHGLDTKYLPLYLSEFCYRFNRRFSPKKQFNRLAVGCLMGERVGLAELRG